MSTDLALLLGTQETATLEFKREVTDRNAIRKAICALANDLPAAGGGDLLIGVDSSGRPVDGVDTSDAALLKITEYRDQGLILDRPSMVVSAGQFDSEYLRQAIDQSILDENRRPVTQQLASLRLADVEGTPSVLGLLLVGLDSTMRLPGAYVQFVRYEGLDVGVRSSMSRTFAQTSSTLRNASRISLGVTFTHV